MNLKTRTQAVLLVPLILLTPLILHGREEKTVSLDAIIEELANLRSLVEAQQRQIEKLQAAVQPSNSATTPPVAAAEPAAYQAQSAEDLAKRIEAVSNNLGGFKLSGDLRFRADVQARTGNHVAGPLQNVRSRYRVRFNVDKDLDSKFRFHLQLSTGPYNTQTTNDQDFGAMAVKHPFSVAEAFMDYRPTAAISLRGGRMEEVFADNTRFLWDDDIRLNGFQQILTIPLRGQAFKTLEIRSGEYFLSNPNVPILAANSPFVAAGYQPGQRVRDASLFHPGFVLSGDLSARWTHQTTADIQLYRNQNQIQLSSTANGFPVVINNTIGLSLSGPPPAVGNATTSSGGAIYTAARYQVARLAYRLTNRGIRMAGREMPFYLDFQVARNIGTHQLRDALMASASLGAIRRFGDVRFLYQFAIKDANSIIAQFTDDDLGTGSTTNIAVHALRFDLGLTSALQWQNLFFIQNARRPNDPAQMFFVPVQRGANTTYRYLGQLAFTF
jgi:hypothetical protein